MAMTLRIKIDCENDAFEDGQREAEISRLLRDLGNRIERGDVTGLYQNIKDSNGNTCGTFRLSDEPND